MMFSSNIFLKYIFSSKPRIFNNSIDSSSLYIFSSSFLHLLLIIERTNGFSKMYSVLELLIYTCYKYRNFFHLKPFSYSKYFSINLSFFSYSFGERKFV